MQRLPSSVIHGDLNDANIICNAQGAAKRVIAFIDFGDCKRSRTVFDVAICIAYFMLNKAKEAALDVMHRILSCYHRMRRLNDDEIRVLFVAVCARVATGILNVEAELARQPENS